MKATIITALILFSLSCHAQNNDWRKKRDTTAVLATYQIGDSWDAQSTMVLRVHVDTVVNVIDSAKSTFKNVVKTTKRVDMVYYMIPYIDTLRENGKPKLDVSGKPQFSRYFTNYAAERVAELVTGTYYTKSPALIKTNKGQ